MALTARDYAQRLRTMGRGGSKAPMQNVQLPTNQTRYQTPSMRSISPGTAAAQQQAMGTDPATLAKAGGLLGKLGKAGWDYFHRPNSLELDKASSANLSGISSAMDGLLGSNVDAASNMAGQTANAMSNLPQPSMLGNGVPLTSEWGGAAVNAGELGNLSAVNDAVTNAQNAASAATDMSANASSFNFPGAGTAIGAGLSLANGNYGAAGGQVAGATAGSVFGPMGTMAGGMIGRYLGGMLD